MAERTAFMKPRGPEGSQLRPGEQMLRFMFWSPEIKDCPKRPLFRFRGVRGDFIAGKLSGFWEDVRTSMHPNWVECKDVEKLKKLPAEKVKSYLIPYIEETGIIDERKHTTSTAKVSVPFDKLPYKADEFEGSFCFDTSKGLTATLTKANLAYLLFAIRNQVGNRDTVGDAGSGEYPRRLWIFGTTDQDEEGDEYERNFQELEKMVGKKVFWELEEVQPEVRR